MPMTHEPGAVAPVGASAEPAAVGARLDELLGGRSEREVALVTRLVGRFPATASDLVERWSKAVLDGEAEQAVLAVHRLRGAALNLGSSTLSRVCEEIESWSVAGDRDGEAVHRERLLAAVAVFARTLADVASTRAVPG